MQVKNKEDDEKFKPITLEIVIESEEELCSLWHRLNINSEQLDPVYSSKDTLKYPIRNDRILWEHLDGLVRKRNLWTP